MKLKLCESVMSPAHLLNEMDFMDSHAIYNLVMTYNPDLASAYQSLIKNAYDQLTSQMINTTNLISESSKNEDGSSACTLGATPNAGSSKMSDEDALKDGKVLEDKVIRATADIDDDFSLVDYANEYIDSQNLKYRIQDDTILVNQLYFKIHHDVDNKKVVIECGDDENCNKLLDYLEKSSGLKLTRG